MFGEQTHFKLAGLKRNRAQPAQGTYFELAGLRRNLLGTQETHFELAELGRNLLREHILSWPAWGTTCLGNAFPAMAKR